MCWIIRKAYPRAPQIKDLPQHLRKPCIIFSSITNCCQLDSYSCKIYIYKHWTGFTIKKTNNGSLAFLHATLMS